MSSIVQKLTKQKLITPPKWLLDNVCYEGIQGSTVYGCSTDDSDFDIVGFCIPPKDLVFPHLAGCIKGFGRQQKDFVCYQQHHIITEKHKYDLNIYNIVHFFHLCMENNPNMLTALFLPQDCILFSTQVYEYIRDHRKLFLHKGAWHRFKGYAYSQMHKIGDKNPEPGTKRAALIEKFGYDVKYAYHLVRLLDELEQILTLGDIDLRRNSEQLKAIRRGEWSEDYLKEWFAKREHDLEILYQKCTLPWGPNEEAIKNVLLTCLEMHYGNLNCCIQVPGRAESILRQVAEIVDEYRTIEQQQIGVFSGREYAPRQ